MKKLAVNIITGFLGSGKTTAIIELFKQKPKTENWIILINEFGKISIDKSILNEHTNASDILEVSGGCICCSSLSVFKEQLKILSQKSSVNRIIIEPSGLGEVCDIVAAVNEFEQFSLKATLCMVEVQSQLNKRLLINGIFLSQIRNTNIIIITKCDISNNANQTINWITKTFDSKKQFYKSCNGKIPFSILDFKYEPQKNIKEKKLDSLVLDSKIEYKSYEFYSSGKTVYNELQLVKVLKEYENIIRIKANLNTPKAWKTINISQNSFSTSITTKKNKNQLVVIYSMDKSINEQILAEEIKACEVTYSCAN